MSFIRILVVVAAAALSASAMPRGTNGILEGRIIDRQSKEPLIGVNVMVQGTRYGTMSDSGGFYRVNNIRAGVYEVKFSILGYKSLLMKDVTILPDLRTRIDIELEQTSLQMEAVEVRAQRPLIQKDLGATAYSIGEMKLEKLPISSFTEALMLQPGTTMEGNVRGGKTTEVMYLVDGLPVQDVIGGGAGTALPRSSITGMTLHTGGFDAEYGNAMSGVVNIITRSGGNEHKLGIRAESDNWLPTEVNRQQDRMAELEVTASGPVVRDRLYYFTANSFNATDTRWWQDFAKTLPSPIFHELSGFEKLDYLFGPMSKLSLQGIYSIRDWRDYEFSWRFNLGGLPPRSRASYRASLIFSQTISDRSFFTSSLNVFHVRSRINEGSRNNITLNPYQYDFFLRYILGGQRNWWADVSQNIYTAKEEFATRVGEQHLVQFGLELNQYDISSDVVKFEPQMTYFGKPILDAPMLNYSNSYAYWPRSGSVYIQDKVELVRDGSNVSFGLRWDFLDPRAQRPIVEFIPVSGSEFQQAVSGTTKAAFKHQFSPRISVAAPVDPTTFLFFNFGQYFQFPLFDYLYSGITPSQLRQGTRNVLVGNPDLEPERSTSWEFGLKHELRNDILGSITYFRKSFQNQIDSKTLVPFDSKSGGDYGFASYVNNDIATATGWELMLSRENNENLSGSISYSYMTTEGMSESANQAINYAQWGFPVVARPYPLSWDQRHTVKIDAEFRLPLRLEGDLVLLYNSARPYTFYPTRDGFTPLDSSKLFLPNNRRMADNLFVNLKLSRRFSIDPSGRVILTVYLDARNVFNKLNVRWMDSGGKIGGELGDPSAYYDPRRVRVGFRIDM